MCECGYLLPIVSAPAYTSHKSRGYVWLSGSTDAYVEVLDGSRVHPETYEWARKMAIDALEIDENDDEATPASALEEILENPDKLRELDLDAFAEELDRQVGGALAAALRCALAVRIFFFAVLLTCSVLRCRATVAS